MAADRQWPDIVAGPPTWLSVHAALACCGPPSARSGPTSVSGWGGVERCGCSRTSGVGRATILGDHLSSPGARTRATGFVAYLR